MRKPKTIESDEITLTPLREFHLADMVKFHADADARAFTVTEGKETFQEVKEWYEADYKRLDEEIVYIISSPTESSNIGYITVTRNEIGIVISKEHRKQNYAYMALSTACHYMFESKIKKILARIRPDNFAAQALVEKLGFVYKESLSTVDMYELLPEYLSHIPKYIK